MGCDIHAYIEYSKSDSGKWYCFAGEIDPGRNYAIFAHLAGVRDATGLVTPIAADRGLPCDASRTVVLGNALSICEDGIEGVRTCSRSNAATLVRNGYSQYIGPNNSRITHPDWHSHSWATTEELSLAISMAKSDDDIEYIVMLDTMHSFERHGYCTRLVFWFDN